MPSLIRYGRVFDSGEMSTTPHGQKFVAPSASNYELSGVRWFGVFFNDPVFTNLRLSIYTNDKENSTYGQLIETSSDVYNLADIKDTYSYMEKGLPFSFDDIPLKAGDSYYVVPTCDTYSPVSGTSYIAWSNQWPDPVYSTGYTATGLNMAEAPLKVIFYGKALS